MALAETAELAVRINLKDDLSRGITGIQKKLGALDRGLGQTGKGVGQMGAGFVRAGALIAGGIVAGGIAVGKFAIDYESAFAGVRKTVDATDDELKLLSDQFRTMATTIPIPATELARLGEIAGALGVKTSGIDEFVRTTALLGVTTDLTADQAASALGRIGNILGLTAEDYDNFGSALVRLGNTGASTEPEIIEIAKRFAAAGKQAGLSAPEILGFAEAAASFTGLNEEAAGSSLSRLGAVLTKVVAEGGSDFELLNKIVGEDFRKALDTDASGALVGFLKGLGKLDKYERASALKSLGLDSVYLRQLLGGLTDNVEDVEKSLANADAGWRGNFLEKEAAIRFETVASKIQLFKQNLMEAGVTIGEGFIGPLGRATEKLTDFLKQTGTKSELKAIGEEIGRAIEGINWAQVLDAGKQFVDVLRGGLTVAKAMWDVFNALPGEVKAATAGFLALNKLSGGLVASGAGNIIGGLTETITRALGSKVPGVGKLFAQPVFVTNWPVGFGAGGPGGGPGKGAIGGAASAIGGLGAAGIASLVASAVIPAAMIMGAIEAFGGGKAIERRALTGRQETAAARGVPEFNRPTRPGRTPAMGSDAWNRTPQAGRGQLDDVIARANRRVTLPADRSANPQTTAARIAALTGGAPVIAAAKIDAALIRTAIRTAESHAADRIVAAAGRIEAAIRGQKLSLANRTVTAAVTRNLRLARPV